MPLEWLGGRKSAARGPSLGLRLFSIDGDPVDVDCPNNGSCQCLLIGAGVDFCRLSPVRKKSAFEQNGRYFNAGEDVEARVFDASVIDLEVIAVFGVVEVEQGSAVHRRCQRDTG